MVDRAIITTLSPLFGEKPKATRIQIFYEEFKDKCNLLAKEGNVAELERLGKAKKAKAEKYYKLGEEDYCSEDLDKSQGSYYHSVASICERESRFAFNCLDRVMKGWGFHETEIQAQKEYV